MTSAQETDHPCQHCLNRKEGCHGKCPKYQEYKKINDEKKDMKRRKRQTESDLNWAERNRERRKLR